jgi:hypothetical protein
MPKGGKGLKEAIKNRPTDIKSHRAKVLRAIKPPGINIYKRVEMHTKYKPIVPIECQDNAIYEKPPQSVINAVEAEKTRWATFNMKELKMEKKKVSMVEMKPKLDDCIS